MASKTQFVCLYLLLSCVYGGVGHTLPSFGTPASNTHKYRVQLTTLKFPVGLNRRKGNRTRYSWYRENVRRRSFCGIPTLAGFGKMRNIPDGFSLLDLEHEDCCEHIMNCLDLEVQIAGREELSSISSRCLSMVLP